MKGDKMMDLERLEAYYQKFMEDLQGILPDGIVQVDLSVLRELDLLNFDEEPPSEQESIKQYFQVLETEDKITLANDQFIIWMVPEPTGEMSRTLTLIALNKGKEPVLEMAFSVDGVYNTSRLVLRILERYLKEIHENEQELERYRRAS